MKITEIFITIILITILVGADVAYAKRVKASSVDYSEPQATVQATPAPEVYYEPVEEYIRLTFGVYGDKAMLLLKGDGVRPCAENRSLNPRAVNDNRTWGGVGVDRGIFQINSVFHPLTEEQAFDYKQNIDYAWRMFENDNYTFKRWTAGRCLGI
jgi:hypothetical protein